MRELEFNLKLTKLVLSYISMFSLRKKIVENFLTRPISVFDSFIHFIRFCIKYLASFSIPGTLADPDLQRICAAVISEYVITYRFVIIASPVDKT